MALFRNIHWALNFLLPPPSPFNKNVYTVHCFCCEDRNIYLEEHYYLVAGGKHKQINPTEFEIAILIAHMARMGKYI